jgi:hypothetical protein
MNHLFTLLLRSVSGRGLAGTALVCVGLGGLDPRSGTLMVTQSLNRPGISGG